MRSKFSILLALLLSLTAIPLGATPVYVDNTAIAQDPNDSTRDALIQTSGRRGWHLLCRPKKKNPADQLAYAAYLRERGSTRRAMRHYLALTLYWPESPEAAAAQYEYARILSERGKRKEAFDEYQRLFENYTGLFPYDEVLKRQFKIALYLMSHKKGRFFIFPGFHSPERAIPLLEKIVENGPQWERAPEAQYLMGEAYEKSLQYEEAIAAYMIARQRYPNSPFAEHAAFRAAHCFYLLAEEAPNNGQTLENAWAAMVLFLNKYPDSEQADLAREYKRTLYLQRARRAYNTAMYYDRIEKNPKAALIAYQTLARKFPHSDWTELAKIRIDSLSKLVETGK